MTWLLVLIPSTGKILLCPTLWAYLLNLQAPLFEIDNSISRQDIYFRNQTDFQLSRWNLMPDIANRHINEFGNDMRAEDCGITYNPQVTCYQRYVKLAP